MYRDVLEYGPGEIFIKKEGQIQSPPPPIRTNVKCTSPTIHH